MSRISAHVHRHNHAGYFRAGDPRDVDNTRRLGIQNLQVHGGKLTQKHQIIEQSSDNKRTGRGGDFVFGNTL